MKLLVRKKLRRSKRKEIALAFGKRKTKDKKSEIAVFREVLTTKDKGKVADLDELSASRKTRKINKVNRRGEKDRISTEIRHWKTRDKLTELGCARNAAQHEWKNKREEQEIVKPLQTISNLLAFSTSTGSRTISPYFTCSRLSVFSNSIIPRTISRVSNFSKTKCSHRVAPKGQIFLEPRKKCDEIKYFAHSLWKSTLYLLTFDGCLAMKEKKSYFGIT